MRDITDASRTAARQWLLNVVEVTGKSLTAIARDAGVAVSTLTRAVNDPDHPHTISSTTIAKISSATGVPAPDFVTPGAVSRGFAAPEAEPYRYDEHGDLDPLVRAMLAAGRNVDPWVLRTRALELAGFLPGDIVSVQLGATPRQGDVVVAQVYDFDRGKAETIWRIYESPYLVAASTDRAFLRPYREDAVAIKGVVTGLFRSRIAA